MGEIMMDYTIVTGVDAKHLWQLQKTWPTWKKHKPDLLCHKMVVFYDYDSVTLEQVAAVIDHPVMDIVPWPPKSGIEFAGDDSSKWTNRQRHKMLAAFVYVPAEHVKTPYWLKLDTDAVATGEPDWIDPAWFNGNPAIISHPWGFTRPGDQMLQLDRWVADHIDVMHAFHGTSPLNLAPKPGEDRVRHRRIGSWCAFFNTKFNVLCASLASASMGPYQLPVASQDGFTWYVATRLGLGVMRVKMKLHGWQVWSTDFNVRYYSQQALEQANGCITA